MNSRDQTDNVADWLKGQFQTVNYVVYHGVPDDTTSVMHYKHKVRYMYTSKFEMESSNAY